MKINNRQLIHRLPQNTGHYYRTLQITLLVGIALATISIGQISRAAAQSTTPVYVLGVSNPLDPLILDLQSLTSSVTILPGVSSLSLIGTNSILFIDGNWLQSTVSLDPTVMSTILTPVLNGLPTVVIRGNPALLQDSVSGFLQFHVTNLPMISEGVKIFNTLPDGTRQSAALQVIAGFDYAVNAEFTWAQQMLQSNVATLSTGTNAKASTAVSPSDISSTSGTWTFIQKLTTDTGDAFKPMGKVFSAVTVFKLQSSGSSSYDWFNFFSNRTILPGIAIYNSPWRNLDEQDLVQNASDTNFFVSHGPTNATTSGPTSVSFSIGPTSGDFGAVTTANQTASFFLKNSVLTDTIPATSQVQWMYNIDPRSDSGKLSFSLMDGWTDRTSIGILPHVQGLYTTTFCTLQGSSVDQTASSTVTYIAGS
jgi:hypothetical protein